ncbi:baseplate hub protein [Gluconobacter oxydans]|uniref:baseplate hub protein n=1 Tax=Gluconobacter oxydans TaxID=442 RepID=UPI0039E86208
MSSTTTVTASRLPRSFAKKQIDVSFTVPTGAIGPGSTADKVTLSGLRVRATVTNAGMLTGSQLSLRVEGMTLAMMNRLSVVMAMTNVSNQTNTRFSGALVEVQAGDAGGTLSTIFLGDIAEAFVDFSGAPSVAFQVLAYDTLPLKVTTAIPTSYGTPTPAATIFSELAAKAGLTFANHGVSQTINSFYEAGDLMKQIDKLARSIHAVYRVDTVTKTLHAWGRSSDGTQEKTTVKLSKSTGLVGYAAYNQNGINVTSFFNPALQYMIPFQLVSEYLPEGWTNNQMGQSIPQMPSSGLWKPTLITHDLAAELPNGPWFTQMTAIRADVPQAKAY